MTGGGDRRRGGVESDTGFRVELQCSERGCAAKSSHKFVAKLFVSIPLALANPSAYLCLQSE